MGYSRDSCYRLKELYEKGIGRKKRVLTNRVRRTSNTIVALAVLDRWA